MIEIEIPSFGKLAISHLVLDFNGTLAQNGELLCGVPEALFILSHRLSIHILTADTFGNVRQALEGIACQLVVLGTEAQAQAKADYVEHLGASSVSSIGNGRNDCLMLERSALGIVVQGEGAARESLLAAKMICRDIVEALGLLSAPLRLAATLRG